MRSSLFQPLFVVNVLASLVFFVALFMLIPVLPLYLMDLGASPPYIGASVGAFTLAALVVRPVVGYLTDRRGPRVVLFWGALAAVGANVGYMLAGSPAAVLLMRGLSGMGLAAFSTAGLALAAALAPADRRGEALGWFGGGVQFAMAFAPLVGTAIQRAADYSAAFATAAAVAAVAAALVLWLPRGDPQSERPAAAGAGTWFHRPSLPPSALFLLAALAMGTNVSFVPLLASARGIDNFAWFFALNAIGATVTQFAVGVALDRVGRRPVVALGSLALAAGTGGLAFVHTFSGLAAAALVFGAGLSMARTGMQAIVVDRSEARTRGAAMATFSASQDLGVGVGGMLFGSVLAAGGFVTLFLAVALGPLACCAGALFLEDRHRRR